MKKKVNFEYDTSTELIMKSLLGKSYLSSKDINTLFNTLLQNAYDPRRSKSIIWIKVLIRLQDYILHSGFDFPDCLTQLTEPKIEIIQPTFIKQIIITNLAPVPSHSFKPVAAVDFLMITMLVPRASTRTRRPVKLKSIRFQVLQKWVHPSEIDHTDFAHSTTFKRPVGFA